MAKSFGGAQTPMAVGDLITAGIFRMRPHENGNLLAVEFYTLDQISERFVVSLREAVGNKGRIDEFRLELDHV